MANRYIAKRVFDVIVSLFGLMLTSPLFIVLAIAIKFESEGPVFFRGVRVGRYGTPFRIFKLRSMVKDAAQTGPPITAGCDPRITRMGCFLRRFKLDEVPQLLNVLKGDMSLVGPRPENPKYVMLYTPEQRRVLSVRPGLTGAASIQYRNEGNLLRGCNWETIYRTVVMPDKLEMDLSYIDNYSFWTDIKILAQTARALCVM